MKKLVPAILFLFACSSTKNPSVKDVPKGEEKTMDVVEDVSLEVSGEAAEDTRKEAGSEGVSDIIPTEDLPAEDVSQPSDTKGETHEEAQPWFHLMDFDKGGDFGFKVLATDDGFMVVGSTDGGGGLEPGMLVIKLDLQGDVKWLTSYGDSKEDSLKGVARAKDGGYFLVGTYYPKDRTDSDLIVIRISETGRELWRRVYNYQEDDEGWGVLGLDDGGCIAVGLSFDPKTMSNDALIVRLDKTGEVSWAKQYGGDKHDYARAIVPAWDGGFAVIGYTASFGEGMHDLWFFKISDSGDYIDGTTIGGSPEDYAYDMIRTRDHNYMAVGATASYSDLPQRDVWLVKLAPDGSKLWDKYFGFESSGYGQPPNEYGYSLIQVEDGDIVVAGSMVDPINGTMDGLVLRTNDEGTLKWMYKYDLGDKDGLYGIAPGMDDLIVVTGYAKKDDRNEDVWIEAIKGDGSSPHRVEEDQ